jgi:hypothetical protein
MRTAKLLPVLALAFVSCASLAAAEDNLVTNASFEERGKGWNLATFSTMSAPDAWWVHSGTSGALTLCSGAGCLDRVGAGSFISQSLLTTPGEQYDLSFWTGAGKAAGEFAVYWNGVRIDEQFVSPYSSQQVTYASLLASSTRTVLEIHGRNDGSYLWLDDVGVKSSVVSMVPEPVTYLMLLAGLGLLGVARACRNRQ